MLPAGRPDAVALLGALPPLADGVLGPLAGGGAAVSILMVCPATMKAPPLAKKMIGVSRPTKSAAKTHKNSRIRSTRRSSCFGSFYSRPRHGYGKRRDAPWVNFGVCCTRLAVYPAAGRRLVQPRLGILVDEEGNLKSHSFLAAFAAPLAAVTLLAIGLTPLFAHESFSAGQPGDPKKPARSVRVTMADGEGKMTYDPAKIEVRRGEQIHFILSNVGALPHEFVLANAKDNLAHAKMMQKYPDMEHDDPNAKTVPPKSTAEILWRFSKRGEFEYACLIPGHREAGMLGKVIVK